MVKPHLISTSAHIENPNRVLEYIHGYKLINDFKNLFKSVTIIETISKTKLDYLENTGLNVFYSDLPNDHINKGVNWFNHVTNFLSKSDYNEDDVIIFITGRYLLINTNIFSLIDEHMINKKIEFFAKDDSDLYTGAINGVHTFFMAFTKYKFLDFSNWYKDNGRFNDCIEWEIKRYLTTHDKCLILPKNIIMGVETRVFETTKNKLC